MRIALVLLGMFVVAVNGLMALDASDGFRVIQATEAATVWGGDCTSKGAQFNYCCSCYHATFQSGENGGYATNGSTGKSNVGTGTCPCNSEITQTITSGSGCNSS
jgi:hypothetical protein